MNIELPEVFREQMKSLLGAEYSQYIKSFEEPRSFGLRVNTLKWSTEECRQKLPCKTTPVPWVEGGLFYEGDEVRLSKDPYYYAGLYYLQEPSAMTPAFLLPVEPGDMVLDLCAAPGGKSTQLGAKLKGKGMLLSNDISNSRAKALLKNLELAGVSNFCVTSESPERLSQCYPEFFDKILVDAPCSGEGMFRKERDMIKDWMERGPSHYAKIQKRIMEEAVKMLKPGGYLMYSTCTFSMDEDEGIVKYIMEEFPDMELLSLPKFEGASGGIGLTGCLRLFPHKLKGEGHFIALMYKHLPLPRVRLLEEYYNGKKQEEENAQKALKDSLEDSGKWFEPVVDFLSHCRMAPGEKDSKAWDPSRLVEKNGMVYYLPAGFLKNTGLRFLRTGLLVGEMKKDRFEPSQAFAMSLKGGQYDNEISLTREDDRVIRYLKGETLSLADSEGEKLYPGWCLVCVDRFPLGWAKWTGKSLKNKYYPGWRWM